MSNGMPPEIEALIEELNRELDELGKEANRGLELAQRFLRQFPDNPFLVKCFATFSNHLFFVASISQRVATIAEDIEINPLSNNTLQENGEVLSKLNSCY